MSPWSPNAIPIAPPTGDPRSPWAVVRVKPLLTSVTFWSSALLFGGAVLDAVLEVLLPMLRSSEPFDIERAWRPILVAVLSAIIAWRRRQQNTVIGSGS